MGSLEFTHQRKRTPPTNAALSQRDERLLSLVRFAGRLAHDFNNFLVPVLGYAALIREEVNPDSKIAQYAISVEKSARKTEAAIEDILPAVRAERQFTPRWQDFTQIVASEVLEWERQLPPHAAIHVRTKLASCALSFDAAQCRTVLKHLLRGARFALATGGTLEIELSTCSLDSVAAKDLGLAYRDFVLLTLTDTGMGMSEDVLRRAFEPSFSIRAGTRAIEVGLAVVHAIIRGHGGQILIESRGAEGTIARIWLPIIPTGEGVANSESRTSGSTRPQSATGTKIVLSTGDLFLAEAIKAALHRNGREVFLAREPQEARKFLQHRRPEISGAIIDISEESPATHQELAWLRANLDAMPLVAIRGPASPPDAHCNSAEPPRAEIKKPFAMKGLLEMLAALGC